MVTQNLTYHSHRGLYGGAFLLLLILLLMLWGNVPTCFQFHLCLLITNICFPSDLFACVSMFLDGGGIPTVALYICRLLNPVIPRCYRGKRPRPNVKTGRGKSGEHTTDRGRHPRLMVLSHVASRKTLVCCWYCCCHPSLSNCRYCDFNQYINLTTTIVVFS